MVRGGAWGGGDVFTPCIPVLNELLVAGTIVEEFVPLAIQADYCSGGGREKAASQPPWISADTSGIVGLPPSAMTTLSREIVTVLDQEYTKSGVQKHVIICRSRYKQSVGVYCTLFVAHRCLCLCAEIDLPRGALRTV